MKRDRILAIFGTRPEAIKMGPVIRQLHDYDDEIETRVVVTGQHRSMLDQILNAFEISPDFDLDIMQDNQSLADITTRSLSGLESILGNEDYRLVMVQGDTTTAFVGALAAFYHRIPVAHIEAGLRTYDKYNPYPEEVNRHFIDVLADLCFAPTLTAKSLLLAEGIEPKRIVVTGNTVIDALLATVDAHYKFLIPALQPINFDRGRHTLLVTVHRRENHGQPLQDICQALRQLLTTRTDLQLVLPVHLNPNVHSVVHAILGGLEHVYLTEPLGYPDFVNLMARSHIIVTDSGGVQEEAPSLGKPVLVIRQTTERPEAIAAGTARLIGTRKEDIISGVSQLLDVPERYRQMACAVNPYGDGHAAERIVLSIRRYFQLTDSLPAEFTHENERMEQPPLGTAASDVRVRAKR
jgi:UDP-N-acetylglucosamine 2-epimerase (non-hydrolysing)